MPASHCVDQTECRNFSGCLTPKFLSISFRSSLVRSVFGFWRKVSIRALRAASFKSAITPPRRFIVRGYNKRINGRVPPVHPFFIDWLKAISSSSFPTLLLTCRAPQQLWALQRNSMLSRRFARHAAPAHCRRSQHQSSIPSTGR